MFSAARTIIQSQFPFLSPEEGDLLFANSETRKLRNREAIITAGQKRHEVFFILKGMVRGYFINQKGEEKNIFLRPEFTFTGPPDTLFSDRVTKYTFEAIQETEVLILNYPKFLDLAAQYSGINQVHILSLQENLQTLLFRVEGLVDQSPAERYETLLERSPQFFQTAFHKHIANYLGITPVSLSRIIKRRGTKEAKRSAQR
ncbi:MAG: Crp/Fnr family transcriptional regulator [Bacteroidota bacterium]